MSNAKTGNRKLSRMNLIKTGDVIRFKNDHGISMVGEVIDKTEEAARVWTPISIYIVTSEQIVGKIPKLIETNKYLT